MDDPDLETHARMISSITEKAGTRNLDSTKKTKTLPMSDEQSPEDKPIMEPTLPVERIRSNSKQLDPLGETLPLPNLRKTSANHVWQL